MKPSLGLKLWSTNKGLMDEAEELIKKGVFQYIELSVIPETDIEPFLSYDLPYGIHATSENHGFNIADKSREKRNRQDLSNCLKWADELGSDYVVLHPGYGSLEDSLDFLKTIDDPRILIENMPSVGIGGEQMIGDTPKEVSALRMARFGFCLDFGHAVKAAAAKKKDYKALIEEFMEQGPNIFHVSDGSVSSEVDEHLALGEGEYDLGFLAEKIKKSRGKKATLETPRKNIDSLEEDKANAAKIRSLL